MTKTDKQWLDFQLEHIERAPEPYKYNGETIGHPFNLAQTIDSFLYVINKFIYIKITVNLYKELYISPIVI